MQTLDGAVRGGARWHWEHNGQCWPAPAKHFQRCVDDEETPTFTLYSPTGTSLRYQPLSAPINPCQPHQPPKHLIWNCPSVLYRFRLFIASKTVMMMMMIMVVVVVVVVVVVMMTTTMTMTSVMMVMVMMMWMRGACFSGCVSL